MPCDSPVSFDDDDDIRAAARYYDDTDVSRFYASCWGGDDIHIGLYESGNETIAAASAAMTRHLIALSGIGKGQRVLDLACGFGGSLRTLARMGCEALGIDISAACVQRARRLNADAGLDASIDVRIGDFHAVDSDSEAFDALLCQESIIHSPRRAQVFAEAFRLLRPGGVLAVSDIMASGDADPDSVRAAFARLGVSELAALDDYRRMVEAAGFRVEHVETRQADIRTHYAKLAERLRASVPDLDSSRVQAIASNIRLWQRALARGDITWACLIARKPIG
ncbi:MAG: methyltransferase domain-containing protein [Gammaproteobacteria bacterium]|nr:methyltransferase domain-containing protein [Gammaproteobacteria bacterium]